MTVDEKEIVWDDGDAERREVLKVARQRIDDLNNYGWSDIDYYARKKGREDALAIIDALIANPNA